MAEVARRIVDATDQLASDDHTGREPGRRVDVDHVAVPLWVQRVLAESPQVVVAIDRDRDRGDGRQATLDVIAVPRRHERRSYRSTGARVEGHGEAHADPHEGREGPRSHEVTRDGLHIVEDRIRIPRGIEAFVSLCKDARREVARDDATVARSELDGKDGASIGVEDERDRAASTGRTAPAECLQEAEPCELREPRRERRAGMTRLIDHVGPGAGSPVPE